MRLFYLLLLLIVGTSLKGQVREQLQTEIEKIMHFDAQIERNKIPSFVIAVVVGDSTWIYGYGSVAKDSILPPDGNTLYEIGGLTKVFTASLLEQLVNEGQLDYSDNLNTYFGKFSNQKAEKVNLLDLVTHTSGLPRMPMEFGVKEKEANNPYAHYSKTDLLDFYRKYYFHEEKGKYLYSNVGYALLEQAIEQATKTPFEELLITKLLTPLQMNDTRVRLDEQQIMRVAQGHSVSGNTMPPWRFKSFAGSEGLKSSANDLVKFISAQVGLKHQNLTEKFANTHQIHFKTDISKYTSVAKGWHVIKNRKYYDSIVHTGSTSGSRVFLGFVKETKTGVVVLSNSERGLNGLGYLVLKMVNNNWKK